MFSRKKIKIVLENPCSESWDRMKPIENGRFCDGCAKKVVDFSVMNEKEIAAYFTSYKGNICGRMKTSQLETVYTKPPQLQLPFHQRMLRYVLSFALLSKIAGEKATAQSDSSAVVRRDSTLALLNDSVAVADSAALADSTVACADDSLPFEIKTEAVLVAVPTFTIDISDMIVCGGMGIVPAPDPLLPDFGKSNDTMQQIAALPGINVPVPQPQGKEEKSTGSFWAAVLPAARKRFKRKFKKTSEK